MIIQGPWVQLLSKRSQPNWLKNDHPSKMMWIVSQLQKLQKPFVKRFITLVTRPGIYMTKKRTGKSTPF
jgi:hypothetical protein